ncbi:histidinol-phosphatase [Methylosinus sp. Ce-a6]|uniref:histidinol-phosphatase n=1 Tax=Methylosinus sp. Ce-a6 TaxID=2172005 RepID=UPI001356D401|nr:histidinol-phosphatase [Methylosinus sp. Ce-a6]
MTAVDFEKFVERLADASGEAILPFFRTSLAAEDKAHGGAFDPVTEADRAAEIAMRRLIEGAFPDHGIIGEEFGDARVDAEYVWVLDPIDGTKSFICGLPLWGTLIGLEHRGRPCYGLMHQPFTRERFSGDGEAAFWRGPARRRHSESNWKAQPAVEERRKLQTRPCASLAEATLMTTSPKLIDENLRDAFFRVEAQTRLSRYGGDCYAYCALAAGHVDLVIETNLNPYDIVALIPIVEGAGGIVTTWDGGSAAQGGAIVAAGDRRAHEAAMAMLAKG